MNINIFGAPHSGKSTFCSELFAEMKKRHFDVEYLPESVKLSAYLYPDMITRRPYHSLLLNAHKSEMWQGVSTYLINESNPLASAFYHPEALSLAAQLYNLYENINFVLTPIPITTSTTGRVQTTTEDCLLVYARIISVLDELHIRYTLIDDLDTSKVIKSLC
jgi:hypothetical protein